LIDSTAAAPALLLLPAPACELTLARHVDICAEIVPIRRALL